MILIKKSKTIKTISFIKRIQPSGNIFYYNNAAHNHKVAKLYYDFYEKQWPLFILGVKQHIYKCVSGIFVAIQDSLFFFFVLYFRSDDVIQLIHHIVGYRGTIPPFVKHIDYKTCDILQSALCFSCLYLSDYKESIFQSKLFMIFFNLLAEVELFIIEFILLEQQHLTPTPLVISTSQILFCQI